MKQNFDFTIQSILNERLTSLEKHFSADVIFFYGPISPDIERVFRDFIEELANDEHKRDTLYIMLNTPGGSAETVERMVKMTRHHYNIVNFIVPDSAYSAGTIFCMSGDEIYMDYSSSLGPIDPQIFNGKTWVPALGYLDKVNDMIEKSKKGTLTQAEFVMLREQDLAMLRSYEQARDLTVDLLKKWLVEYKFKTWTCHSNGNPVTEDEKNKTAKEIANKLGDNKLWHSHGRSIGIDTLTKVVKLKIKDYSGDKPKQLLIRNYNDLICQYIMKIGLPVYLHSRMHV